MSTLFVGLLRPEPGSGYNEIIRAWPRDVDLSSLTAFPEIWALAPARVESRTFRAVSAAESPPLHMRVRQPVEESLRLFVGGGDYDYLQDTLQDVNRLLEATNGGFATVYMTVTQYDSANNSETWRSRLLSGHVEFIRETHDTIVDNIGIFEMRLLREPWFEMLDEVDLADGVTVTPLEAMTLLGESTGDMDAPLTLSVTPESGDTLEAPVVLRVFQDRHTVASSGDALERTAPETSSSTSSGSSRTLVETYTLRPTKDLPYAETVRLLLRPTSASGSAITTARDRSILDAELAGSATELAAFGRFEGEESYFTDLGAVATMNDAECALYWEEVQSMTLPTLDLISLPTDGWQMLRAHEDVDDATQMVWADGGALVEGSDAGRAGLDVVGDALLIAPGERCALIFVLERQDGSDWVAITDDFDLSVNYRPRRLMI